MQRFSVVIPNWNGERFLATCFEALRRQDMQDFETILVDNGSTDGSLDLIAERYPEVKIIRMGRNTGFACAVNEGIRLASAPLIALLNNDTEADKSWLSAMESAVNSNPDADFFASKMLDYKNRKIIDSCGNAMSWSGRPYKLGGGEQDGPPWNQDRFVFGACAGAAVYRKELFEKIGMFDELYVTYLEDVDIDFRAQLAGLRCYFVPRAIVYHKGSGTSGKGSEFSFRMMIKNHFHLVGKNFPTHFIWRKLGKLVYSEVRLIAAAFRDGHVKAYFQGLFLFLRESGYMLEERQIIQSSRKTTNAYLEQLITSEFAFEPINKALRGK